MILPKVQTRVIGRSGLSSKEN
uniref:Uncharacterized protein n=1 Tax=Rhizophora mucronata TaxID=61149 RepID=A0A2P2P8W9_RHIMU